MVSTTEIAMGNDDKIKAVQELAPLMSKLNRKISEIVLKKGINLSAYIYKDKKLCGNVPVVCIDVFKRHD